MGPLALAEAIAGGLLLFFVPGYAVAKALFPERRLRGPDAVRWGLELAALSFVLSVVLTVVLGYVLLVGAPGGFSATWADPLLEAALAAVAAVAFAAGWLQGAYAREPRRPAERPAEALGPWELDDRLDRLQRERLRLERELRRSAGGDAAAGLRERIAGVVDEERSLQRRREAEYDA
jgi:hypothetical protein